MDDITLLQECVVKVEEIKEELCDTFENRKRDIPRKNSEEVNAAIAVPHQTKMEMEEAEEKETKPFATMYLFPEEEEQLENPLAEDPLADCEEWNEKKLPTDSLLFRVKKEEATEAEDDAGTSNERSRQAAFEEMKDDSEVASGSKIAETVCEERGTTKPENEDVRSQLLGEHEPQILTCDMYQRHFAAQEALVCHIRAQAKETEKKTIFPCEICRREFKREFSLKRHLRIHTGKKPYVCDHCGKEFTEGSALNRHRRNHTEERPYSCSICDMRFADKSHLVRHTRCHFSIKPYECKECGKTFVKSGHYTRHLRVHPGEGPYTCSVCSKTFARKEILNIHQVKHEETLLDRKTIQCKQCGKSFLSTQNLKAHMLCHTGERYYKCDTVMRHLHGHHEAMQDT